MPSTARTEGLAETAAAPQRTARVVCAIATPRCKPELDARPGIVRRPKHAGARGERRGRVSPRAEPTLRHRASRVAPGSRNCADLLRARVARRDRGELQLLGCHDAVHAKA